MNSIRCKSIPCIPLILSTVLLLILFSLFFPGNIDTLDRVRIKIQSYIIKKYDSVQISSIYTNGSITYEELIQYCDSIEPSTLLFSSHGKNVCALIPNKWKHSVIYIGSKKQLANYFGENSAECNYFSDYYENENDYLIVDASFKHGVSIRSIKTLANLNSKSTLKLILCLKPKLTVSQSASFLMNCIENLGKDYDLNFSLKDTENIYCTELIQKALLPFNIDIQGSTTFFSRDIMLPSDMVDYIFESGIPANEFEYISCVVRLENATRVLSETEACTFSLTSTSGLE